MYSGTGGSSGTSDTGVGSRNRKVDSAVEAVVVVE